MTKMEKNIYDITVPLVNELGYDLYDVMYVKEGKDWFLRFFIDKETGIDLDDCEKVSNVISDKLDEIDPISTSYSLEVSSCGLERHLREIEHYISAIGKQVELKFFKNINGKKEVTGILKEVNDEKITLDVDDGEFVTSISDISSAKILYNWEDLENE